MTNKHSRLKRFEDIDSVERILEAISQIDENSDVMNDARNAVSDLSSNTIIEQIEAARDGIFQDTDDEDKFEAVATVYVTLNYGGSRDAVSIPDSYPAIVYGNFDENQISVDSIMIDTSSFYGEEQEIV